MIKIDDILLSRDDINQITRGCGDILVYGKSLSLTKYKTYIVVEIFDGLGTKWFEFLDNNDS